MIKDSHKKCKIIAEVAQAHDGSFGIAKSFIDAVSDTGVDIIKFQTHIAKAETTKKEPWRIKFSEQDKSRYDYWKRMEFNEKQWLELKNYSEKNGLKFMSSPFSLEAVNLLKKIDTYAWKIASGEINNDQILDSISESGKEIYLSTGMSSIDEIDSAVEKIKKRNLPLTIMQCTSMYPTPPDKIGLNNINLFKERYNCNVGLSDHSSSIFTGIAAASLGINALEVHVTFDKNMFGPDTSSSLTISELKTLIEGVRYIENILNNDVDKNKIAAELKPLKKIFSKSIVYKKDLPKNSIITKSKICFKKPGNGVDPSDIKKVIGKKLAKDVKSDDLLLMSDLK